MMCGHIETIARRKSGGDDKWEAFLFQRIGSDGTIVQGGIPRILKKGKHKGLRTWDSDKRTAKVVVTDGEVEQEERRYEKETNRCSVCFGTGEVFKSWSIAEGVKKDTCKRCGATGKAKH